MTRTWEGYTKYKKANTKAQFGRNESVLNDVVDNREKRVLSDGEFEAWKLLSSCVYKQQKIKNSVEILERIIESERRLCKKKTRNGERRINIIANKFNQKCRELVAYGYDPCKTEKVVEEKEGSMNRWIH